MRYKQWIFDMDGTLTDSMTTVWRSLPDALLAHYGRTPHENLNEVLLTMGMQDGGQYLIQNYQLPLTEESYMPMVRSKIAELYKAVDFKPGVREMLARLKAEGVRMCICSNTWAEQCEEVLTRLGVSDYFEFYYTAQGEHSKRHPEVFDEVMRRLGGTDPSSCMVCEDAVYSARTAASAGFAVIGIADVTSAADEPEMRRISTQFLQDWTELDWDALNK